MANVRAYGRWLKERREEVRPRLTRKALAEAAGVSGFYISRLEQMAEPEPSQPIHEPGADKVDDISQALESFLGRPLVNEARRVLGYPLIAEESLRSLPPTALGTVPPAGQVISVLERLLAPETAEDVETVEKFLRFPRRKREMVSRMVALLEHDDRVMCGVAAA